MTEPTLPSHMIDLTELEFRYGDEFRLSIPKLSVERGSTAAVIGPNGSGKTTLLHVIAGIVHPAHGRVVTNGADITGLGENARRDFRVTNIGLVFQEFELLEYLNVLDNILLPYRINRSLLLDRDARSRALEIAHRVGLGKKVNRFANCLSQGEKQRVAVCRSLLPQPELLLADEPTGNLDPINKKRVLDILFEYAETNDATLVTVTHDHDLLGRFARVIDFKDFEFTSEATRSPAGDSPDHTGGQ